VNEISQTATPTTADSSRRPDRYGVGPAARAIGLIALSASVLYFLSDVIEAIQGGFSTGQLWLTLVAEAAVPVFVLGLAVLQRPRLGRLGQLSALAYAYAFVFFTGTVVYALVHGTEDYAALSDELGAPMVIHGAVMVVAGLAFGSAVLRARAFPAWTAGALMTGVVLVAVAQGLPASLQLIAAGIRDVGFAGMGAATAVGRQSSTLPADQRRWPASGARRC